MAETAFQYHEDVIALATKAKVHPHDVEPCEWCGIVTAVLHLDCEKRPFHLIRGSFSPAKTVECAPPSGAFTWRPSGRRGRGVGWRIGLVTRYEKQIRSKRARHGVVTARYNRHEIDSDTRDAQDDAIRKEPLLWSPSWRLRNVWVRVVDREIGDGIASNVSNEHEGVTCWFDLHAWGPMVWGEDPAVVSPDLVEFSCELHPVGVVEASVAERLQDAAAGRGP